MAGRYKRGWSKQHQEVFKLSLSGMTTQEIVEKTELPYDKVRNIMRTEAFKTHEIKITQGAVEIARKLLENRLLEAANKIVKIMRQGKPDERLKFDAAKEILYQCGMKPVEVVETRTRQYTPEEIESSLTVIREVQAIEEKLSTHGSGFLVERSDGTSSSPTAPVEAGAADVKVDLVVEETLEVK